MVPNIICSFFGTVAFSVLFNVPKRFYIWCGLTGAAGWLCYCATVNYTSTTVATFLGALLVVLMSRILAVWQKCPITVFLVAGIFPLIPGAGVYYTAYYLVTDSLRLASLKGIESVKIAFAIVLGIVFIVSIPREVFQVQYWKDRRLKKLALKKFGIRKERD